MLGDTDSSYLAVAHCFKLSHHFQGLWTISVMVIANLKISSSVVRGSLFIFSDYLLMLISYSL